MLAVPIVLDLDHPERRALVSANGMPPTRFVHAQRDGRAIADLFELDASAELALPTVLAELRGMRAAGSEGLGRALVAAGGVPARHAHVSRAPDRVDGLPAHAPLTGRRKRCSPRYAVFTAYSACIHRSIVDDSWSWAPSMVEGAGRPRGAARAKPGGEASGRDRGREASEAVVRPPAETVRESVDPGSVDL